MNFDEKQTWLKMFKSSAASRLIRFRTSCTSPKHVVLFVDFLAFDFNENNLILNNDEEFDKYLFLLFNDLKIMLNYWRICCKRVFKIRNFVS